MLVLHLLCLLSVNCLITTPQSLQDVPTHHPELIEGPWEVASASGIDGISFEIETSSSGKRSIFAFTTGKAEKRDGAISQQRTRPARNRTACRMIIHLSFSTGNPSAFITSVRVSYNHSIWTSLFRPLCTSNLSCRAEAT